jgi:hypothetical protein
MEAQTATLRFLKKDHGPYIIESPLVTNPLAQELELEQGDILATFDDWRFVVKRSGDLIPIPRAEPS